MATMRRKQKKAYLAWLNYVITKDEMTREEAFYILKGQLLLPAEEVDCGLIDKCLDHLYPDRATRTYPTKEPTWQRIMQTYQEKEANRRRKKIRKKRRSLRPGIAIALFILLAAAAGSTIAYALGVDVWSSFVSWTKDIMSINIRITDDVTNTDQNDDLQAGVKTIAFANDFQRDLSYLGFTPKLPTWMPDGFVFLSSKTVELASGKKAVSAWFTDGNGRSFSFDIDQTEKPGDWNYNVETSYEKPYTYYIGETEFLITRNIDQGVMTWVEIPYIIYVNGDLTRRELKQMADSIFTEDEGL